MTDFKASDQDVSRAIRSWLHEDRHEDVSRVAGAVLDQVEATPQRRSTWWPARRTPIMHKIVTIGLGAAAVVAALFIGVQLFSSPSGGLGADPTPTATPEPTQEPTPVPSAAAGLPQGPFVVTGDGDPVNISFNVAAPGWVHLPAFDGLTKDDDGLDPPETVGATVVGWAYPVGTGFNVYGDPCQWSTTIPDTPATTPEDIAAALAAQASRDATEPVDVTIDGYAGKAITLHVPMSYEVPGATRDEEFADCDQSTFASWGLEANESVPDRYHQGPGQIDELWIIDFEGSIVILDAMYGPATPADLVEELRALAESADLKGLSGGGG